MRKSCFLLAAACLAPSLALASSGSFGNLDSVTSTGTLGNLSTYIGAGDFIQYFNTDNGQIFSYASGGFVVTTLPFTTVTEYAGGPTVNVFNFANFDVGNNSDFSIVGSQPAVIAASGNITITGSLKVASGGGAGGIAGFANYPTTYSNNGYNGGNPGGGQGGQGPGEDLGGVYGGWTGGSAGGGGSVSPGQAGSIGTIQYGAQPGTYGFAEPGSAGGSAQNTAVLQGGGGGGGSAGGYFPGEYDSGVSGGAGGGALFFITPGNMTVTGSLTANGGNGTTANVDGGSSGGGAGGELWFDVGGTFDNEGLVAALGGAGGNPGNTGDEAGTEIGGAGSGGQLVIDPTTIINNGTLDVSDGNDANIYGGNVELLGDTITGDGQILGEVPEPSSLLVLIPSVMGMLTLRRRKA